MLNFKQTHLSNKTLDRSSYILFYILNGPDKKVEHKVKTKKFLSTPKKNHILLAKILNQLIFLK